MNYVNIVLYNTLLIEEHEYMVLKKFKSKWYCKVIMVIYCISVCFRFKQSGSFIS